MGAFIYMEKSAKRTVLLVLVITAVLCMTAFCVSCSAGNHNSKAVQQKIAAECPFELAKEAEWKIYPSDNQAGLTTVINEHDGQVNRATVVLDKSASEYSSAEVIRNVVTERDYFMIMDEGDRSYWRDFEDKEVCETGNYIFARVQYDSRKTLTGIMIGTGPSDSAKDGYGKGVYFIFPEPFRVTYYIYGGSIIEMSQEYDDKTSKWSTVAEHEGERTAED